jgi:hypothetical protein
MMEAAGYSETFLTTYDITWCQNLEDCNCADFLNLTFSLAFGAPFNLVL